MCRWRKDHPPHFVAKPSTRSDGSSNLFEWDIKIPARPQSYWYPGIYSGKMTFTRDYPERPPKVTFNKIAGEPLYHPNVYLDGGVCLSIINPPESNHHYGRGGTWKRARATRRSNRRAARRTLVSPARRVCARPLTLVRVQRISTSSRCCWRCSCSSTRQRRSPQDVRSRTASTRPTAQSMSGGSNGRCS